MVELGQIPEDEEEAINEGIELELPIPQSRWRKDA